MSTKLQDSVWRFEKHCDECEDCDLVVELGQHGAPKLVEISFTTDIRPTLCPEGRNILMDIFN